VVLLELLEQFSGPFGMQFWRLEVVCKFEFDMPALDVQYDQMEKELLRHNN